MSSIVYGKRYLEVNSFFRGSNETPDQFTFNNTADPNLSKVRKVALKSVEFYNALHDINQRNDRFLFYSDEISRETVHPDGLKYWGEETPVSGDFDSTVISKVVGNDEFGYYLYVFHPHPLYHSDIRVLDGFTGIDVDDLHVLDGIRTCVGPRDHPFFHTLIVKLTNDSGDIAYSEKTDFIYNPNPDAQIYDTVLTADLPHLDASSIFLQNRQEVKISGNPDVRCHFRYQLVGSGNGGKWHLCIGVDPASYTHEGTPVFDATIANVLVWIGNDNSNIVEFETIKPSSKGEYLFLSKTACVHDLKLFVHMVVTLRDSHYGDIQMSRVFTLKSGDETNTTRTIQTTILPNITIEAVPHVGADDHVAEWTIISALDDDSDVIDAITQDNGIVWKHLNRRTYYRQISQDVTTNLPITNIIVTFGFPDTLPHNGFKGYDLLASSGQGDEMMVFDGNNNTSWRCQIGMYDTVSGLYVGSKNTVIFNSADLPGEWYEIHTPHTIDISSLEAVFGPEVSVVTFVYQTQKNGDFYHIGNYTPQNGLLLKSFEDKQVVCVRAIIASVAPGGDGTASIRNLYYSSTFTRSTLYLQTANEMISSSKDQNTNLCYIDYVAEPSDDGQLLRWDGIYIANKNLSNYGSFPTTNFIKIPNSTLWFYSFNPISVVSDPPDQYIPLRILKELDDSEIVTDSSYVPLPRQYEYMFKPRERSVTIPTGDYDVTSLLTALTQQLLAFGITLTWNQPGVGGPLTFMTDKPMAFYSKSPLTGEINPLAYSLGITGSSNGLVTSYTADDPPDIDKVTTVYIRSDILSQSQNMLQGADITIPAIAVIPAGTSGTNVFWREAYQDNFAVTYQQPANLSTIDVTITDQLGHNLGLNRDINLLFEITYEV